MTDKLNPVAPVESIQSLNELAETYKAADEIERLREDSRKFRWAVKHELFREGALCRDQHFAEDDEHHDAFDAVTDAAKEIERLNLMLKHAEKEISELVKENEELRDKLDEPCPRCC